MYGPEFERGYTNPFFKEQLNSKLLYINRDLLQIAIREAIAKLKNIENGSLEQKNSTFRYYLQNGVYVTYQDMVEEKSVIVKLIDFENIDNNSFDVINQRTVEKYSVKRLNVIIFLNGLPLIAIELKYPSREEINSSEAYRQLKNYMKEIPSLFIFNVFV